LRDDDLKVGQMRQQRTRPALKVRREQLREATEQHFQLLVIGDGTYSGKVGGLTARRFA
jgi:hypothetical protein